MDQRQYDKPCNKCGVQITMRQGADTKWKAYEYQSNQLHQCANSKPPAVTPPAQPPVTQQPKLGTGPVVVSGFTPEVENWLVNLMKRAMKEYMEAGT